MKVLPDVMFVIDPTEEYNAVREARKLGIPVVGVCDTNADPNSVDIIIPGNDDAARSVRLFCVSVADAIIEGREANKQPEQNVEENAQSESETADSSENTEITNVQERTEGETEENLNTEDTTSVDEKVEQ